MGATDAGQPREIAVPELVRLHGGQLYGLGLRLCGSPEDAEDMVQEAFLRAYQSWDSFEGRSKSSTWLYRIASNVCQRLHRRRAGEPTRMASMEELVPFEAETLGIVDDGAAQLIHKESIGEVEQAVAALPIDFRMPLILKDIVGFPIAEVAKILGIKEATIKTRVHRARLKLRQTIERRLPKQTLPPAAYSEQVCADLLSAKQDALDRGIAMATDVICQRCAAVFATLDLTQDACRRIGRGELPERLLRDLLQKMQPSE